MLHIGDQLIESKIMKIIRFTLIEAEYNEYNGFFIELLGFETKRFDRALFGIGISSDYIQFSILFSIIEFKISPKYKGS